MSKKNSAVAAIEAPAGDAPVVAAVRTVKIEKLDLKGNGKSFRFFVKNGKGQILTAKSNGVGANFKAGDEIAVSALTDLSIANDKQLARFNSAGSGSVDASLLD